MNSIKDKIDWKFFNLLLDKLTEYEDIGHETEIYISVYVPKIQHHKKILFYKMFKTLILLD